MKYQPHNLARSEQGPEAIIIMRPQVVDGAVRNTEIGYSNSRTIKGMNKPILGSIWEQFLISNALPEASPTIAPTRRMRLPELSPLSPLRFARRVAGNLVNTALSVFPSSFAVEATASAPHPTSESESSDNMELTYNGSVAEYPEGHPSRNNGLGPVAVETIAPLQSITAPIVNPEVNLNKDEMPTLSAGYGLEDIRAYINTLSSN